MGKSLEKRVEILEEIVKQLGCKLPVVITASKAGDTFEILGLKWTVLDITEKGYICLADKLESTRKFDSDCNDWKASDLRNYLNTEFFQMLAAEVGEENIIPFERDLLSMDGQTEYGTCEDKVSLINVDEYRKYRKYIPNAGYYWWTITPDSTKCNEDSRWVRYVSPHGHIGRDNSDGSDGVRTFCIFSPSIFESEEA